MRTEAIDWLGVLATEEEIRNNNLGRSNCIVNKWVTILFKGYFQNAWSSIQYSICGLLQ